MEATNICNPLSAAMEVTVAVAAAVEASTTALMQATRAAPPVATLAAGAATAALQPMPAGEAQEACRLKQLLVPHERDAAILLDILLQNPGVSCC